MSAWPPVSNLPTVSPYATVLLSLMVVFMPLGNLLISLQEFNTSYCLHFIQYFSGLAEDHSVQALV